MSEMPAKRLWLVIAIAMLAACSEEPAAVAGQAAATPESANDTAQLVDATLVARLGIVFDESDPQLMAGAHIVRGTLRVGDRVVLLNNQGGRSSVRIDEIKDDASAERVPAAGAPAGVFLIFTADTRGAVGAEQLLVAEGGFADYASAKTFVDAQAEAIATQLDPASAQLGE